MRKNLTKERILADFNEVHPNKYNYEKSNFIDLKTKIEIICPTHGSFFQSPKSHKEGCGCKLCFLDRRSQKNKVSKENFIKRASSTHNNKYDYSESNINILRNKIKIICPIHGEFNQEATLHLLGSGCPDCGKRTKNSELNFLKFLKESLPAQEIVYQAKFDWLGRKSFDFYIPSLNVAIEYQGEQHYIPIKFFGGEETFKRQLASDKLKISLCEKRGIQLIHFSYKNYKSIGNPLLPLINSEEELLAILAQKSNNLV